jgi:8-oxo-dGTP pyrophosphatase MutT (NUDIX family)
VAPAGKVAQAGAIAFRHGGEAPRFLVVTSKRSPGHWIFPKGHVEPGETAEAAALRELAEEGGVLGEVVGRVGASSFRAGGEEIEAVYFLVRAAGEASTTEGRARAWLTLDEARARLTFDDARALLETAAGMVTPE